MAIMEEKMAITGAWERALKPEFAKPYYAKLYKTVLNEYRTREIYPPSGDIFNAFSFTPLENVRAVILGQDPYHGPGQANGLCFSVHKGIRIPPSLVNIYKELNADLGCPIPDHGDLTKWAKEGVLLLNTVLTVRAHEANSHRNIGWEEFTDAAIRVLAEQDRPMVFIHPSPFSASGGFFGSRPFSRTNDYLVSCGLRPIDWMIE